jgi:hypothetical protein
MPSMLFKKIKSYITYLWGNGYSVAQRDHFLFLTASLQSRCKMWSVGVNGFIQDFPESLKAHLSLDEIEEATERHRVL